MSLTVKDACTPHPSVLRSDPEPDIEDIGSVLQAAEADAEAFFARNHVTGVSVRPGPRLDRMMLEFRPRCADRAVAGCRAGSRAAVRRFGSRDGRQYG